MPSTHQDCQHKPGCEHWPISVRVGEDWQRYRRLSKVGAWHIDADTDRSANNDRYVNN